MFLIINVKTLSFYMSSSPFLSQEMESAAELSSRMKGAGGIGEAWQQQGASAGPPPPPGGQSEITVSSPVL